MRSFSDMISCRNAPLAPGGDPDGWLLIELESDECRFPVAEIKGRTRFCAMPIEPDARSRGASYCACHRAYLRGLPSAVEEDRAAA